MTRKIVFIFFIIFIAGCRSKTSFISDVESNSPNVNYQGYKGVQLVKAYGESPNAPDGTPKNNLVQIAWPNYETEDDDISEQIVLRVKSGEPFNLDNFSECTLGQETTCQVCSIMTSDGTNQCEDNKVAASPAVYDYVILLKSDELILDPGSQLEEMRVKVNIPPANMVLVQRDSVNFEMCDLMGKEIDPLENNRCVYDGPGATPYSTGHQKPPLDLPDGFYDFGYNLFVDRYEAGCNWTAEVDGGMCGINGASGDCHGSGLPDNSFGNIGQIYYRYGKLCYIKDSDFTWKAANSTELTAQTRAMMYTIDPHETQVIPPITNVASNFSSQFCPNINDPHYGKKRLLRLREFVAISAPSRLVGDFGYKTADEIEQSAAGFDLPTTKACNTQKANNVVSTGFGSGDELVRNIEDCHDSNSCSVKIGSSLTTNCQSRYGVQDIIGNVYESMSDTVENCATSGCEYTLPNTDDGNRAMLGLVYDGSILPSPSGNTISLNTHNLDDQNNYVYLPLGLPVSQLTLGQHAIPIDTPLLGTISTTIDLWPGSGDTARSTTAGNTSTWGHNLGWTRLGHDHGLRADGGGADASHGFRCVLPAS